MLPRQSITEVLHFLDRRSLLVGASGCVTAALFSLRKYIAKSPSIRWDELVDRVTQLASSPVNSSWNQEGYVSDIASLCQTLDIPASGLSQQALNIELKLGHPAIQELARKETFQMSLIVLEKDDVLPVHDHPRMTGVTLCLTGDVQLQSYSIVPDTHVSAGSCILQRKSNRVLSAGQVSTLTMNTRNIHGLEAKSRCVLLDVFKPCPDPARAKEARSYVLQAHQLSQEYVEATICC